MQNIIKILLAFVILLQGIACAEDILSKFKQNGYKIKDKRTDVIRYNKNIFYTFEITTFKYNRTTPAHNGTVCPKVDVDDKLEIVVQAFKFLSNEYRHFPIRFQVNLQKTFDSNIMGFQNLKLCGNLTSFVFHKNVNYYFCNFVADDNYLPPLIPKGIYKAEILVLYLNQEAAVLNLYGEIYTPTVYTKK